MVKLLPSQAVVLNLTAEGRDQLWSKTKAVKLIISHIQLKIHI